MSLPYSLWNGCVQMSHMLPGILTIRSVDDEAVSMLSLRKSNV